MKKTKLFISIASMCISLSVLVFGIYAAEQVNYQINGTLTYEVNDCYIDVETNVYYSPTYLTQGQLYSKIESIVASNDTSLLNQLSTSNLNFNSYTDTSEGANEKELTLTFEGEGETYPKQAYFVVMKVSNIGSNTINVGVNAPIELPNNVYSVNSGLWTSLPQNTQATDNSKRLVVAFALEDRTSRVSAQSGQQYAIYSMCLKAEVDNPLETEMNVFTFNIGSQTIQKMQRLESLGIDLYIPSYHNGRRVTKVVDFSDCTNLTSIHVPSTVIEMGENVFANCRSLTALTLPFVGKKNYESLEDLLNTEGDNKFLKGSPQYLFGKWRDDNEDYGSHRVNNNIGDGMMTPNVQTNVYSYETESYDLPEDLETVNLLYGCKCINAYCFADIDAGSLSPIVNYTIPCSVTRVEDYAFAGNTISDLSFLKKVNYIGYRAFLQSSYTSVTIYQGKISDGAFLWCYGLEDVELKEGVTYIGESAFGECSIESLIIPSTVTEIGEYAFGSCTYLEDLILNNGLQTIGVEAFCNCTSLQEVVIPSGVTSLGDSLFSGCTSLTRVYVPETVTEIGEYAFAGCSSLESLTLPFIGRKNYTSQANLREVENVNNNSKDYMGTISWLFDNNSADGMKSIDGNLRSFKAPESLTSLTILDGCTCMNAYAMAHDEERWIRYLYLPSTLVRVEDCAFKCFLEALSITIFAAEPPVVLGNDAFEDVGNDSTVLYVPKGCVSAYENATGWDNIRGTIQEIS